MQTITWNYNFDRITPSVGFEPISSPVDRHIHTDEFAIRNECASTITPLGPRTSDGFSIPIPPSDGRS